jgi:hypothetical protein
MGGCRIPRLVTDSAHSVLDDGLVQISKDLFLNSEMKGNTLKCEAPLFEWGRVGFK